MYKGDVEKGLWGLEIQVVGEKEMLDDLVKELNSKEGLSIRELELCAGAYDPDSEEEAFNRMAEVM